MADFEIIEADFQQFYNLDISKIGFRRYARLLQQLPIESRMVQKYSPYKDWTWEKEVQSQILRELNIIATNYVNANRKKGTKKIDFQPLFEPAYVTEAKKQAKVKKQEDKQEQRLELEKFFSEHNNNVNKMEKKNDA